MDTDKQFKRRRTRLKDFVYQGEHTYFITICANDKQLYFNNDQAVSDILSQLKLEAEKVGFSIFAYCFMPDHLHLLLIGNEEANLIDFIKIFKQKTGFYFKQKNKVTLWHKGYYEHVVRKRENIIDIAAYILENPVRKKMVDDFRKYPYLGSLVFEVNEFYDLFSQRKNIDVNSLFRA